MVQRSADTAQRFLNLTASEIVQGMQCQGIQCKANIGEEAELTPVSMSIPRQDLTLPKLIA